MPNFFFLRFLFPFPSQWSSDNLPFSFLYKCMQNPRLRIVYRLRKWPFPAPVRKIKTLGRKIIFTLAGRKIMFTLAGRKIIFTLAVRKPPILASCIRIYYFLTVWATYKYLFNCAKIRSIFTAKVAICKDAIVFKKNVWTTLTHKSAQKCEILIGQNRGHDLARNNIITFIYITVYFPLSLSFFHG